MSSVPAALIEATQRGWPLIPLKGKVPVLRDWPHRGVPTLDELEDWRAREYNLGLLTGDASGLVVVDIEHDGPGPEHLGLPETWTVRTGGGGLHLYYRLPEGVTIRNSVAKLAERVDVRGNGGQVVFVGSVHPTTGAAYTWLEGFAPNELDLAELPEHIISELNAERPRLIEQLPATRSRSAYGRRALEKECDAVASAQNGTRNHTLNRAAHNLGQLVAGGELDQAEVEQALLGATSLPEGEARRTIQSGLEAGLTKPRSRPVAVRASSPAGSASDAAPPAEPIDPYFAKLPAIKRTPNDLGNARRFLHQWETWVRYSSELATWFWWDGTRWRPDITGHVRRYAVQTVDAIKEESRAQTDSKAADETFKHYLRSGGVNRVRGLLDLAKDLGEVPIEASQLDRGKYLLNVRNGTLDLRTGALAPHDAGQLLTKICRAAYDPGAQCPTFLGFLDRIMDGNADLIAFLQRVFGYACTGDTSEQCLFLLIGGGANGKSTLLSAIRRILSKSDYYHDADMSSFKPRGQTVSSDLRPDLAELRGRRLVAAVEADETGRLDEALVKRVTGGEFIRARIPHARTGLVFEPEFKLFLALNHEPVIRGCDDGIWRRIRKVPFKIQIPKDEQDPELYRKLQREADGILTWLVAGARGWWTDRAAGQDGLLTPNEVRVATESYRNSSDPLGCFLADRCELDARFATSAAELRSHYEAWCKSNAEEPMPAVWFGRRLRERGLESKKTGSIRKYKGIRILPIEGESK